MKQYTILKTDGVPDWERIPAIHLKERYEGTPDTACATAQICYSEDRLHLLLCTCESITRREESGPLGWPCHDSCLEFFFCPIEGDCRYFNIEFNANKCLFLGFGTGIDNLVRLIIEPKEIFHPDIRMTEEGWQIEYTIPFSFVRLFFPTFAPAPGVTMRANCYKCADEKTPPEFLSWSRVDETDFTFHRPSHFGTMVFGE